MAAYQSVIAGPVQPCARHLPPVRDVFQMIQMPTWPPGGLAADTTEPGK
jgi:hypothetical protein